MKITADFTRLLSGENLSRVLKFTVDEVFFGKKAKLGFITPRGNIYFTEELSYKNGEGEYVIPSALTDGKGILVCQLYLWDETGFIAKSPQEKIPVYPSIDDKDCIPVPEGELKSLALVFGYIEGKADIDHSHDDRYYTKEALEEFLRGRLPGSHTHDERYYTEAETDELIIQAQNNAMLLVSDLSAQTEAKLSAKSDKNHNHDDSYYTEAETDGLISKAQENAEDYAQGLINDLETGTEEKLFGKSDKGHTHDERYYTEAETDELIIQAQNNAQLLVSDLQMQTEAKLSAKSDKNHNHDDLYCTEAKTEALISEARENAEDYAQGLVNDLETGTEEKLFGKSDKSHLHDDRYYTEAETDELISQTQNNAMLLVSDLSTQTETKLSAKSDKNHTHDDIYPTKSQVTAAIAGSVSELSSGLNDLISEKSDKTHTHDDRYYTEAETDDLISTSQYNSMLLISELSSQTETKLSGKSDVTHTHSFDEITDIPDDFSSGQGQGTCLVTATADFENYIFTDVSHTFKAIEAAFRQGKYVFVMLDVGELLSGRRVIVPLTSYGASMIMFETVASIGEKTYVITGYLYSDDETGFTMTELVTQSQLNGLTFKVSSSVPTVDDRSIITFVAEE